MKSIVYIIIFLLLSGPCWALEKYGRPLPEFEPDDTASVSGYWLSSVFAQNDSFTARPDNTGLAGMRYMLHLESDLIKDYLTVYTDQNAFSDKTINWVTLSEWDQIYGVTGEVNHWGYRVQYEKDSGLDRRTIAQQYFDVVVMRTFELSSVQHHFPNQSLTGYLGIGNLLWNENYFARPDNTGRAFMRYMSHADINLYKQRAILFLDLNFFSDKKAKNQYAFSEMDWMVGLAFRWKESEIAILHEQDRPVDRSGFIQQYLAIQWRQSFDLHF